MSHPFQQAPQAWQEDDVLSTRSIVLVLCGALTITLVMVLWVGLWFRAMRVPTPSAVATRAIEIGPFHPRRDDARRALDSYEWVDRENGLIRIPVERAMDLMLLRQRQK